MLDKIHKEIYLFVLIILIVGIFTPFSSSSLFKNNLTFDTITYDIYFGITNPPPKIVTNQTKTMYIPGILEHETTYYWQIVAWDDQGNNAQGPIWHFTTVSNQNPVAIIIAPSTGFKREDIVFDGSDSYDPDGYIVEYFWDFDDGVIDNGMVVTHQFSQSMSYNVVLIVEDDDGKNDLDTHIITINNRAPVAYFVADQYYLQPGDTVTFDSTGSYDPDGDNLSYIWEIDDNVVGTDPIISYTFNDWGNFIVMLTVTDDDILNPMSHSCSAMIFVNAPPIADFTYSPQNPFVFDTITFNGSISYDMDGSIVNYSWGFGDMQTAYGMIVNHQFIYNGWFNVTLTVTDDMGSIGVFSENIFVQGMLDTLDKIRSLDIINIQNNENKKFKQNNLPILFLPRTPSNPYPEDGAIEVTVDLVLTWTGGEDNPPLTPVISGVTNGTVGEEYEYCIGNVVDPDGDSIWVFWDWGDDTNTGWLGPYNSGEEVCANHSWDKRGIYIIKARLKDYYGAYSEWGYLQVSMPKNNLIKKPPNVYLILKYLMELIS